MNVDYIAHEKTGYFSKLALAYINNTEDLKPFYNQKLTLKNVDELIAQQQKTPINRAVLVATLKRQNSNIRLSQSTQNNIDLLSAENTFTITTGHQLNLATGPLYIIYKIAAIIKLCQQLKKIQPKYNFVPLFWMNTEDHDFEEINHFHLFGEKFEWQLNWNGPVGKTNPKLLQDLIETINEKLGDNTNAAEIKKWLESAYLQSPTLADANRKLINHLFGKYGLVILDQNDAELKTLVKPLIKDQLSSLTNYEAVKQTSKLLEEAGFHAQAYPREINLFWLTDTSRERIVLDNNDNVILSKQSAPKDEEGKTDNRTLSLSRSQEREEKNVILNLSGLANKSESEKKNVILSMQSAPKDEEGKTDNRTLSLSKSQRNNAPLRQAQGDIASLIETHPQHFSFNVISRPLYQQSILPNLAYIGGGGELAYWLQLKEMFAQNNIFFPSLILRPSFLFVDANSQKKQTKLGLSNEQLFAKSDELLKQFVAQNTNEELDLENEKKSLQDLLEIVKDKALKIDATLEKSVVGEQTKMLGQLEKLEAKMLRAEKRKFEQIQNQIEGLKDKLFPNNSLQERHNNFIEIWLKHGLAWIDELLEIIEPLKEEFGILKSI